MECVYVCMYVSDFKLFGKIRKRDFVSMNVDRSLEEMLFGPDVSITIFLCHVPVIYCNVTGMREKRNEYRFSVGNPE